MRLYFRVEDNARRQNVVVSSADATSATRVANAIAAKLKRTVVSVYRGEGEEDSEISSAEEGLGNSKQAPFFVQLAGASLARVRRVNCSSTTLTHASARLRRRPCVLEL